MTIKKATAILLIVMMLTSPGLLIAGADIDEVWDAGVLKQEIIYFGDTPVYDSMEIHANAWFTAHYSFDTDFQKLAGKVKTLALQDPLIPAVADMYPITGMLADGTEHVVGVVAVADDLSITAQFYDNMSFTTDDPEENDPDADAPVDEEPGVPDDPGIPVTEMTISFAVPCVIDPAQLPAELADGELGTVYVTSGGIPVALLVSEPVYAEIMGLGDGAPPPSFSSYVNVSAPTLYRVETDNTYTELTTAEKLEIGDNLLLIYEFNADYAQVAAIKQLINAGASSFFVCEIPIPEGLMSENVGTAEILATGPKGPLKFATLSISPDGKSVLITFEGSFWDQTPLAALTYAEIELFFSLDEEMIESETLTKIRISESQEYEIRREIVVVPKHTLNKTVSFDADTRTFTWTVTFTATTDIADGIVAFSDTFNNAVHTYIYNSAVEAMTVTGKSAVTPLPVNWTTNAAGKTGFTYTYNAGGPIAKDTQIKFTYQTQLNADAFDSVSYGTPTMASNTIGAVTSETDKNPDDKTRTHTVTVNDKKTMLVKERESVRTVDGVDYVDWTITVRTFSLPLKNLRLHDEIPTGLELSGVVNIQYAGYNGAATLITGNTCGDGCTFAIDLPPSGGPYHSIYTITYTTKVLENALVDSNSLLLSKDFVNRAWLTYDWDTSGPYPGNPPGQPEVVKDVTVAKTFITKKAVKYNRDTNTIEWKVTLNTANLYVESGTVTDIIPDDQKYVAGTFTAQTGFTDKLTLDPSPPVGQTLSVTVGEIGTATVWFTFETEVINKSDHPVTNVSKTYKNGTNPSDVEFVGTVIVNTLPITVTDTDQASITVTQTVLEKTGRYNYEDNTITWTVTVNKNAIPMKNAVVTDIIPKYQTYNDDITFDPAVAGAIVSDEEKENGSTELIINLGNAADKQKIIFTYTTTVDVDNDPRFKGAGEFDITNGVSLKHGDYDSFTIPDAEVPVTPYLISKDGSYNDTARTISYSVVLNPFQLELHDMHVTDAFSIGLELDWNSIKLYEATRSDETDFDKGGLVPLTAYTLEYTGGQTFAIRLPTNSAGKSYILEYDCLIISTLANIYYNTITLNGDEITSNTYMSKEDIKVGRLSGSGIYRQDYGRIKIIKKDGNNNTPLPGITFELWAKPAGIAEFLFDSGTTDSNGNLEFNDLPPNTAYRLVEVENSASGGYSTGSATVTVGNTTVGLSAYWFNPNSAEPATLIAELTIANYPPGNPPPVITPTDPSPSDPDPSPSDPDEPTEPSLSDPTEPTDPTDPTDPTEPTEPTEPSPSTPIPGSPEYPPVEIGTVLVPTDDGGFIELDEDGTPLGTWHYDEDEEMWIFEPYVPLGIAQTGDSQLVPVAIAVFVLSVLVAAYVTMRHCFGLLKKKK